MARVTTHAAIRLKQRVKNNNSNKSQMNLVLQKGFTKYRYFGDFFYYLNQKEAQNSKKLKVYGNSIYVFGQNSKNLVTTYLIPNKFLPISKYELDKKTDKVSGVINKNRETKLLVKTIFGKEYYGICSFTTGRPYTLLLVKLDNGNTVCIETKDVKEISSVNEVYRFWED